LTELDFVDFHLELNKPKGIRALIKPQVNFLLDKFSPFKPLPLDQSCAFFEWGLNWAIAQHAMHYLIIHSAVVEKSGKAIIFPGIPGAGKSTLCAALCHHGWRLLSDEQALISVKNGQISPLARPICLKNESIDIISKLCPDAKFGTTVRGTSKGDLSHIKAPTDALALIDQCSKPSLIVFPQYAPEIAQSHLTSMASGVALIEMITHCFNYTTLGRDGFNTLARTVKQSKCYQFRYNDLNDAMLVLNELHEEANRCDQS